jgi:hypothetical protein
MNTDVHHRPFLFHFEAALFNRSAIATHPAVSGGASTAIQGQFS